MCELGERLRRAREEKGLSLKEASARLALKAKVLEALEAKHQLPRGNLHLGIGRGGRRGRPGNQAVA
ncbi:helix-turn-helix domain-containing protein [Thermus scotoductus]|uniref:helix-turn-helix domain-containing protein n=1 Tax=Thermus scotoductus TaxID=37636 RepID=UPI003F50E8BB